MNDSDDTIIRNNCDGDVGIVAYSDWHCDIPLKFKLGGELESFNVRYETYGRLNEDKSNAILVCHALTGDHHCAGPFASSTIFCSHASRILSPSFLLR